MFAFLIALGASNIYKSYYVKPNEPLILSLNDTDVFYINTAGLADSNVTFTLKPHMTIMKLEKGSGYFFSGDTLEIEVSDALELPLWLIPKGYCTYNNYIINADFSFQFRSEGFSKFCIFTPLNYNSGAIRYSTERYSVDEGTDFLIARSNRQKFERIKEMSTEKFSSPFVFLGLTDNLDTGDFRFEINVAHFNDECMMQKIFDVSGQEYAGKWEPLQPKCVSLREPAFSLTTSGLIMTVVAFLTGYTLIEGNYLDWKRLIGYEHFRRTGFPAQTAEPPRAEEEHLDIDLIQDPPLEHPANTEATVL